MIVPNNLRRPADAASGPPTPVALGPATEHEELVALMLDELGLVHECNRAGERLFGYRRDELIRQHVSRILPRLGERPLLENGRLDSVLLFRCRIGGCFHALSRDGECIAVDLYISDLGSRGSHRLRILVRPVGKGRSLHHRAKPRHLTTSCQHPRPSPSIPAADGESA